MTDPAALAAVVAGADAGAGAGAEPVAAYLALSPFLFAATVAALHRAGLAHGSSIVLESPSARTSRKRPS